MYLQTNKYEKPSELATLRAMSLRNFIHQLSGSRHLQYWFLQFAGWMSLAIYTLLSLTLYYHSDADWKHIAHTFLQSPLGLIISLPLRPLYLRIWNWNILLRLLVVSVAVLICALVWTVTRMLLFIWMADADGLFESDFGGWFFPGMFVYLSWTLLFYCIHYYQLQQEEHLLAVDLAAQRQEEYLKRLKAETVAKEAQLKMLRYQINPHFLFNTLNTIKGLVYLKDNDVASDMIIRLSSFLRYSLESNPLKNISLEKEVETLKVYLDIEVVRFSERLQVRYFIDEAAAKASVPSMILQPLVENAIKYAISPSENGGFIEIKARVESGYLCIMVCDDGPGIGFSSPENKPEGCGVGLQNTEDRLKALYEEDYRLELIRRPEGGAKVLIRIPYSLVE